MNARIRTTLFLAAVAAASPALAEQPGHHPAYVHALVDLHSAAAAIDHRRPEDGLVSRDEQTARAEIDAAISDLQSAAGADGKRVDPRTAPDVSQLPAGPLHAADDLLHKVRSDVSQPEDDPRARPFQKSAIAHVEAAAYAVERAIGAADRKNHQHG